MQKKQALAFVGILITILGCTASNNLQTLEIETADGMQTFWVEIADNEPERAQGLMYRAQLEQDHGMLFVYEKEQPLGFWMKNTKIPLDIIFLNKEGKVINWETAQPCEQEPCRLYWAEENAQFVLEVNAGKAGEWKLETGQALHLPLMDQT